MKATVREQLWIDTFSYMIKEAGRGIEFAKKNADEAIEYFDATFLNHKEEEENDKFVGVLKENEDVAYKSTLEDLREAVLMNPIVRKNLGDSFIKFLNDRCVPEEVSRKYDASIRAALTTLLEDIEKYSK